MLIKRDKEISKKKSTIIKATISYINKFNYKIFKK